MAWGGQLRGCAHEPAWHEAAQQWTCPAAAVAAAIETEPAAVTDAVVVRVAYAAAAAAAVAAPGQSAAAVVGLQRLAPAHAAEQTAQTIRNRWDYGSNSHSQHGGMLEHCL
jgi:hypothetical protein